MLKRSSKPAMIHPAKRDRSAEFASFKPVPRINVRMAAAQDTRDADCAPIMKTPERKSQAIRDSARDEACLVRLPGCPGDYKLTIWSHNRHARAGKGRGIKSIDLNGCYACAVWCDAIYDGQMKLPPGVTREQVELAWYHAHAESLVKLRQKGLA